MSDNGNGVGRLYNSYFPLPPYYRLRFSNGPVWIEFFPTTDLVDFAYGGALINQTGYQNAPPSLMAQINDYLISEHFDVRDIADKTQYVFWGGANDVLFSPISNETLTAEGVKGSLARLEFTLPFLATWQISKLIEAGATNILVMLMFSWSNAPLLQTYSPAQRQVLSNFAQTLNTFIQSNISATPHEGVNLQFFDTFNFMDRALANPRDYGLVNVTSPCLENWEIFLEGIGGEAPVVCKNPDEYFFWDGGGHPTAKVHAILANEVTRFLNWQ